MNFIQNSHFMYRLKWLLQQTEYSWVACKAHGFLFDFLSSRLSVMMFEVSLAVVEIEMFGRI